MQPPKKTTTLSLQCIEPHAAGIDVGAREIYVAVPPDRDPQPVRRFATFTEDLRQMAGWLKQCGITTVAMESTGVYWIPAYEVLEEAGLEVCLVNARHLKHVPGRKSDVSDCQWLQYLHTVGLLRGSFRPASNICALRALSRHRASLVEVAAIHVQHMHKALTQMNLQIHHVLSDITGVSGLKILDAIVAGQRNPQHLASLCDGRVQAPADIVRKSLLGNYRPEHLFTLRQSLAAYRHYQSLLAECDHQIEQQLRQLDSNGSGQPPLPPAPNSKRRKNQFHFDMRSELYRIFGTDLTAVPGISALTAHCLLAEVGPDISRFPNAGAFASWLTLCPGSHKSGGKVLSSKTRKSSSRLSTALRLAAQTLYKSQSYLGGFYRRLRSRLPAPQALTAAAHKLARILYHLLKTRSAYDHTVFAEEEKKQALRHHSRLRKQAHALGFQLVALNA